MTATIELGPARYTFGGDEFLFVEVSEEMSLQANFRAMLISRGLSERIDAGELPGIVELCPANASLLLRFDPDVISPDVLEGIVREVEEAVIDSDTTTLETRIVEVPVWYADPFTAEVVARFREGYHQDPLGTDLDYAAAVNDFASADEFIRAHYSSPWLVTMVGFVAGLPFMYQLVDREHQLQVPKYLAPRTDTPKLTIGHGGCFCALYSVRGAGGYQMFGVAAAPIFEPEQKGPDFADFMIFFKPGDIVRFRPIEEAEYYEIQAQVEANTYSFKQAPVTFDLDRALTEGRAYNDELQGALK